MSVVAVMPVGPGSNDTLRAGRVARAIARWEPGVAALVVAIDGVPEAAVHEALGPLPFDVRVVVNPRDGSGDGGYDGLAVGLTAAYARVAREFAGAHVLKLDTDALVVAPFAARLDDYFAARPAVGMAGTFERNPDGTSRDPEFYFGDQVTRKFLRPLWYWHSKRWLSSPYFGRYRRFAGWMRRARSLGLPLGRHVQGGGYALSGAVLAAWRRDGLLDDPLTWLHVPSGEDGAFSIWTVLAGFGLANFNGPGEVFAVRAKGMPLTPEAVVGRGYAIVHCLKTGDWPTEEALAARLTELAEARAAGTAVAEPAGPGVVRVVVVSPGENSPAGLSTSVDDDPAAVAPGRDDGQGFSHRVAVYDPANFDPAVYDPAIYDPAVPPPDVAAPGLTRLVAPASVESPGGRAAALATAFGYVARRFPLANVVVSSKAAAPDAVSALGAFAADPRVGVAGTLDPTPRPAPAGRRWARWVREAARTGTRGGRVAGDDFAVSGLALRSWLERGWLERPSEWLGVPTDAAAGFSLWAARCGMEVGPRAGAANPSTRP